MSKYQSHPWKDKDLLAGRIFKRLCWKQFRKKGIAECESDQNLQRSNKYLVSLRSSVEGDTHGLEELNSSLYLEKKKQSPSFTVTLNKKTGRNTVTELNALRVLDKLPFRQYMTVSPHSLWWKSEADFYHQESAEQTNSWDNICLILIYNICKIKAKKKKRKKKYPEP